MRSETGEFGDRPSGAAFGWQDPPRILRGWPVEEVPAKHRRPAYVPFMTYCRELLMASPTTRDYAHKTKAYAEQRNAEEIERAAAWARTLRERFEAARDAPGGYIREHADDFCPTAMPIADQAALAEHIDMLFADADVGAAPERVQDFGPWGRAQPRTRAWLWERLERDAGVGYVKELWRLLGLAVADTVADTYPSAEACEVEVKRALAVFRQRNQDSVMETATTFVAIFEPLPDICERCARGAPCCLVEVPWNDRVLLAQIEDLDLTACGWTMDVMRNQLRKRNLLRRMRSATAFEALVDAKVWPAEAVPTDRTAMLPSFASLERPELVELFKKVLRGEASAADDWDWESLEPELEAEAPDPSEASDAGAFAARRNDGADWEEAAFNSIDE